MDQQNKKPAMHQRIFKMAFSMETVSIYLLCCNLVDTEQTLSSANIRAIWNGTENILMAGIEELLKRNILSTVLSDRQGNTIYRLVDAEKWHVNEKVNPSEGNDK
ncbi:hypothetical protein ACFLZL_04300 [Thermodesulfobacteriota bacterium]